MYGASKNHLFGSKDLLCDVLWLVRGLDLGFVLQVRESKLSGLGMTSVATAFKWAGVPEVRRGRSI